MKGLIKMTQKKKKLTMITGVAVGVVMLAGAALANYNTSNGYDVGKLAAKALLNNENYTSDMTVSMSLDGEALSTTHVTELYDRNGDVRLNRTERTEGNDYYKYYGGHTESKVWMQDGTYINLYEYDNGEHSASVYQNSYDWRHFRGGMFDGENGMSDEDKKTSDKMIRFAELIGDTLVGDLKNNIVYVSGDDDSATYELNLDSVQIPEFVNAGLSAIFSQMQTYDVDDPLTVLGDDPIVSNASLRFTVDKQGRLLDGVASGSLKGRDKDGEIHTVTMDISLTMADYGTTKPERLDMSTLPEDTSYYTMTEDGAITHSYLDTEDED